MTDRREIGSLMKMAGSTVRAVMLALLIALTIAASITNAYAHPSRQVRFGNLTLSASHRGCNPHTCDGRIGPQYVNDPGFETGIFLGQITALVGPASNPSRLTIQLGTDSVDIRIAAKTMITGKSAEADVEGLVRGDYAVVRAKRVNHIWFAMRITFDVQPIAPMHLVSGTILRVSPDAKHFSLRADVGKGTYLMRVTRQTRFTVDARPSDVPLPLFKGAVVQILCRKTDALWTAYAINIRSSA